MATATNHSTLTHSKFNQAVEPLTDLIARTDLRRLFLDRYPHAKRRGKWVSCRSPYRDTDHSPSFAVSASGYTDFGTGERGGVLDWIALEYRLDRTGAIQWLREYHGGSAPPSAPASAAVRRAAEPQAASWRAAAERTIAEGKRRLYGHAGRGALDYLHQARGLSDAIIRRAELGYNEAWRQLGANNEDGKPIYVPPGILIPYRDHDGELIAVRVRTRTGSFAAALGRDDDQRRDGTGALDKYLSIGGSRLAGALYLGGAPVPLGGSALIVEGEFDALIAADRLAAAELPITVITLGSASAEPSAAALALMSSCRRILVMLDNDAAGRAGAERLIAAIGERAERAELPPINGERLKDVTDFVNAGGDLALALALVGVVHSAGVPDSWRSAIVNDYPNEAPIYELASAAAALGMINPQQFTSGELASAAAALGASMAPIDSIERTIRRALCSAILFRTKTPTEIDQVSVGEFVRNSKTPANAAGRRAALYTMLPLSEIKSRLITAARRRLYMRYHPTRGENAALAELPESALAAIGASAPGAADLVKAASAPAFADQRQRYNTRRAGKRYQRASERFIAGLDDLHSSALPSRWPILALRDYRSALMRAFIGSAAADGEPVPLGGSALGERLGVDRRQLGALAERAGVKVYGDQRVTVPVDPQNVTASVTATLAEFEGIGRPMHLIIGERAERVTYEPRNLEFGERCRAAALAGHSVSVVVQLANKYELIAAAEPPSGTGSPSTAARRAADPVTDSPAATDDQSVTDEPSQKRRRTGSAWSRRWVRDQLALRLRLMNWIDQQSGSFVNPHTGEMAPQGADGLMLAELLTGSTLAPMAIG